MMAKLTDMKDKKIVIETILKKTIETNKLAQFVKIHR